MRTLVASTLLLLVVLLVLPACGPAPSQQSPGTGDHGWFCPKARYQTCHHTQPDCIASYPGDVCVLTKPVYCENDTTCFATRHDCEYWSICYAR